MSPGALTALMCVAWLYHWKDKFVVFSGDVYLPNRLEVAFLEASTSKSSKTHLRITWIGKQTIQRTTENHPVLAPRSRGCLQTRPL